MGRWLLVVLLSIPRVAMAGADFRATDRFYFGASAGAVVDEPARPDVPAVIHGGWGFDISYWGSDFFAVRMAMQHSGYADDWGIEPLAAVPLRYVQLYGGPHFGLRTSFTDTAMDGHAVVGAQAYLGPKLRLFVQLDDVPLDALRFGPHHQYSVFGGMRWSPDFFHSARPANKFDSVWWTMSLTFVVWGLASLAQ